MAVADTLRISDSIIGLGLAVDNVLGLIYFPLISWIADTYENDNKERRSKPFAFSSEGIASESKTSDLFANSNFSTDILKEQKLESADDDNKNVECTMSALAIAAGGFMAYIILFSSSSIACVSLSIFLHTSFSFCYRS